MSVLVCPLSRVADIVTARSPERVVSILDPEFVTPDLGSDYAGRHLRLAFHDTHEPRDGLVQPGPDHIAELVSFLETWTGTGPLLVHCRAGIGRSTATAYVAACLHDPGMDERTIADTLRRVAPLARPNQVLVDLADGILGREGRMSRAISETGQGLPWIDVDEGVPFELPAFPSGSTNLG